MMEKNVIHDLMEVDIREHDLAWFQYVVLMKMIMVFVIMRNSPYVVMVF